jgi:4'-phosphopantetheinyl transferase
MNSSEVHIWQVSLQAVPSYDILFQYLAEDERRRADRYVHQVDRARFIVARGVLRVLLGYYLGIKPGLIVFEYGEHGKPTLASGALSFNLSHTGDWVSMIFAKKIDVGIDIECIRELDMDGIAARFFSEGERSRLQQTMPEVRLQTFFQIWARKEAFIKTLGSGLFYELQQFDAYKLPAEWTMQDFVPAEGYVGAWATNKGVEHVSYYSDFYSLGML